MGRQARPLTPARLLLRRLKWRIAASPALRKMDAFDHP
jgi:hypothetical protein